MHVGITFPRAGAVRPQYQTRDVQSGAQLRFHEKHTFTLQILGKKLAIDS